MFNTILSTIWVINPHYFMFTFPCYELCTHFETQENPTFMLDIRLLITYNTSFYLVLLLCTTTSYYYLVLLLRTFSTPHCKSTLINHILRHCKLLYYFRVIHFYFSSHKLLNNLFVMSSFFIYKLLNF
jgi:hypothetical protein